MIMNLYTAYLDEIESRKKQNLKPKPIDNGPMVEQLIKQILDKDNQYRDESVNFFTYNIIPGTTSAAKVKAKFLKEIILAEVIVDEITPSFALELLSHMNGGPSVDVLLDLALGSNLTIAKNAAQVLKTQVFLYEADTNRLKKAYNEGNAIAKDILESYAKAEFYTNLPDLDEEIEVISYVAAEGDISTCLLYTSPSPRDAHESRMPSSA